MTSATPLRIDFVSDVACPWCAVGLFGLQQALRKLDGTVAAEIHLQPFELEPDMPYAGQDAGEHIQHKYGISAEQSAANRKALHDRAATVGFDYNVGPGSRVWNTFDAHRLLHWAATQDAAKAVQLKRALFGAYFTRNENVADHAVLLRLATEVGFDAAAARAVIDSDSYADVVRAQELEFQRAGIHSVPATIINGQYLIAGGQPPEVFESALREIAAKTATG